MPKRLLSFAACLLLLASTTGAQDDKKDKKVLKNADIVLMTQNQFDDPTLIRIIEVSDSDFDISGGALIDLKNQGVTPAVLRAMLESVQKKRNAAPASSTPDPSAQNATTPAPSATSVAPSTSDPNFASRSNSSAPATTTPMQPAMVPQTTGRPMAMRGSAGMVNPQQLAQLQAQMASMGMGGMMGSMGMGGMGGGFGASYSPEQMPHVFLKLHPEGQEEFSPSTAQIGQTKYNGNMGAGGMALRSLATEGLSFAAMGAGPAGMMAMSAFSMASGFMPGMRPGAPKMTYVWGLPGRKSAHELADTNPMFELSYGEIPGVDPDAYEPTVLKLVQSKDNYRLVGATQMKMTAKNMRNGSGPENGKWISEDRWPCHVNKEERGFYILHVDSQLEPGEYAVVLRPVKGYKAVSSGLGGHAQVFYSVWDFSVPGATPEDNGKKKKKH
jgi:hypothetical protein